VNPIQRRHKVLTAVVGAVALIAGVLAFAVPSSRAASHPWKLSASFYNGSGKDGADNIADISCPSRTVCEAVGLSGDFYHGVIFKTSDAGRHWTPSLVPSVGLESIACPSSRFCVATGINPTTGSEVGGSIWVSQDSGEMWTHGVLPKGVGPAIGDVFCSTAVDCLAAAEFASNSEILRSTNHGVNWSVVTTLPRGTNIGAMTCSGRSLCFAGGARNLRSAEILKSTNGGSTWTAEVPPQKPFDFVRSITCMSRISCVAVGWWDPSSAGLTESGDGSNEGSVWTTDDAGRTWRYRATPSQKGALTSVSCVNLRFCVAVGQSTLPRALVLSSDDGGKRWTVHATIGSAGALEGIDCVSPSLCWIASWGPTEPNGGGGIFTVT
jgi:photosystem II stability/assembly factor-like uncharacterized protein